MADDDIKRAAEVNFRKNGSYALSVWSFPGLDAAGVARTVGDQVAANALPHRQMRQSTVQRVRDVGFDVTPSPPPPGHVDINLPGPMTDEMCELLDGAFDPPEANPIAGGAHA
jgi:hypothetical protein